MPSRLRVNEIESLGGTRHNVADLLTKNSFTKETLSGLRNSVGVTTAVAIVLGHSAAGDGGGGIYRSLTGSSLTDNDGSIIVDSGGTRWKLWAESYSIAQFGAKGDGVTNDTARIQTAMDAAAADGKYLVRVPWSDLGYRVQHTLDMPRYVTIKGSEELFIPNLYTPDVADWKVGHTFLIDSTGSGTEAGQLILMRDGCSVLGINFYHMDQVETNPPDLYPPVIRLQSQGANIVNIRNVLMMNPSIGIDATGGHQNLNVIDVAMEPLRFGVRIDEATQVDRLTRLDIGGYWHRQDFFNVWDDPNHVVYFMQANSVGVEVGRADDFVFTDCLFYGTNIGITFGRGNNVAYGKISDCAFDFNQYSVRSNNGANPNGIEMVNCTIIPSNKSSSDTAGFYLDESVGRWTITNVNAWGESIRRFMVQLGGTVSLSNIKVNDFDLNDAAIIVEGGQMVANGIHFADIGSNTGNYFSVPNAGTTVYLNAITWGDGSPGNFEAFDPNGQIVWIAEKEGGGGGGFLESASLGGFKYRDPDDVVFFSAWLDAEFQTEKGPFLVNFDTTVAGSRGYSTSTRKFMAPVTGVYQFSFSLTKESGSGLDSGLNATFRVNGGERGVPGHFMNKTGDDASGYVAITQTMTRRLVQGDTVEVYHKGSQKLLGANGGNEARCWFQGFLL